MSRYLSRKNARLTPYTPGEQPKGMEYIKLNTNESPFAPSPMAIKRAEEALKRLNLYSDPEARELTELMAKTLGVSPENVLMTNGSDEILNFAFMAFCGEDKGAAFADITYGFYPVFAQLNGVDYREIPLDESFRISVEDYLGLDRTIFIANPNAPTGIALPLDDIERILQANPNSVVVVDEAYVDFGGESAVKLIDKYDNLLVTQTFSKSRSMAGARLGMGIAGKALIDDLKLMKYSTNPYNVNSATMAAGIGCLEDSDYMLSNCKTVMENRAYTQNQLIDLGFEVLPSATNFLFARSDKISGERLYLRLKEKGILVRHFKLERIKEFIRITIGSKTQMDLFIKSVKEILCEEKL